MFFRFFLRHRDPEAGTFGHVACAIIVHHDRVLDNVVGEAFQGGATDAALISSLRKGDSRPILPGGTGKILLAFSDRPEEAMA